MGRIGEMRERARVLRMAAKGVYVSISGYEIPDVDADLRSGTHRFVPAPGVADKLRAEAGSLEAEADALGRKAEPRS